MSIQTQGVFMELVSDTIIQDKYTVAVSNMRKSIKDTNVILNMAITPGVILVPSNMIILTEMVAGYNNILTLAGSDMKFGENDGVNYSNTAAGSKKTVGPKTETVEPQTKTIEPQTKTIESGKIVNRVVPDNPNTFRSEMYLLVIALIGGSLVSRFVV